MAMAQPKQQEFTFTIERTFDASRDRVWKAFTERDQMVQWFGPKGSTIPECTVDLRPGGASRYTMDFSGARMHGQWLHKEIQAPEKLVSVVSFLDEKGNIIEHPGMPGWPKEILSTVTFTESNGKTIIRVDWRVYNATDLERQTFETGAAGMAMGWGGSFDQLAEFLAK